MSNPLPDTQRHFHDQLDLLEVGVLALGGMAERSLGSAMESLSKQDPELADVVIAGDDELDALYMTIEKQVFELLALQNPMGVDLRLISAVLHTNMHLERIGDMAVNIAKIGKAARGLPTNETMLSHLNEMTDVVRPMIRTAVEAFAKRDLELAMKVVEMDEPVDRINRGMYRLVAQSGDSSEMLEWAARMMVVSRQLERAGDYAVDIAEQVAFLLTGEFREFTDASRPDLFRGESDRS